MNFIGDEYEHLDAQDRRAAHQAAMNRPVRERRLVINDHDEAADRIKADEQSAIVAKAVFAVAVAAVIFAVALNWPLIVALWRLT